MTSISANLRLVDFDNVAPDTLKNQVISAIDTANAFLDNMSADNDSNHGSTDINAKQALADIMTFDHINLALDRSWGIL